MGSSRRADFETQIRALREGARRCFMLDGSNSPFVGMHVPCEFSTLRVQVQLGDDEWSRTESVFVFADGAFEAVDPFALDDMRDYADTVASILEAKPTQYVTHDPNLAAALSAVLLGYPCVCYDAWGSAPSANVNTVTCPHTGQPLFSYALPPGGLSARARAYASAMNALPPS